MAVGTSGDNSILATLCKLIEQWWLVARPQACQAATCARPISFVKAASKPLPGCASSRPQAITVQSHLAGADDWIFLFDLPDRPLAFPPHIVSTTSRPDVVIYSDALRRCILAELTSPMEDRVLTSSQLKMQRYASLQSVIIESSWTCDIITFEAGARGYISSGLRHLLKVLGVPKRKIDDICSACSQTALRASYSIFLHHRNAHWPYTLPFTCL